MKRFARLFWSALAFLLVAGSCPGATRVWDGGGDGNSWTNAPNWSGDTLPVAGDDVVIDVAGTNATIRYTGGSITLASLRCEENFRLMAGTVTLTNGASWSHGGLEASAAAGLTVRGVGTTFSATGTVTADGASLSAQGGAVLSLPSLGSYSDTAGCCGAVFEATGTGSVLELPGLTNLTGNPTWTMTIRSTGGGEVNASNVTRIGNSLVSFLADGTGSRLKLDGLTALTNSAVVSIEARNNGSVMSSNLVDASRATLTIGTTGSIPTAQLKRLLNLSVTGQNRLLASVTNADGGSLTAFGGATISLPAVATYADLSGCCGADWQANGAGSAITLAGLTNLAGNPTWGMTVRSLAGGQVQLPATTRVSEGNIGFLADGVGSVVSLPVLASPATPGRDVNYEARNSGSIQIPSLADGLGATFTIRSGGQLNLAQLKRALGFTIQNTNLTLPALTNIDNGSLSVSSGGSLTLPAVTSFVDNGGCCGALWEANGPGTVLSLPALTNYTGNQTWTPTVRALAGGQIQLGSVTRIPDSNVYFLSDGANSLVNLASLVSASGPTRTATFEARNAGTISIPLLVDGTWSSFAVRSGATLNLSQLTRFAGLTVDGGILTLPAVTNINGASLSVSAGGSLTLPGITQHSDTSGCCGALWEATGSGSRLSLPSLANLSGNPTWVMTVRSMAGGRVDLGGVALIPEGNISFLADGLGSRVVLSNLTSYASTLRTGWFEARNSGVLELTPGPFSGTRAVVTVQSNGDIQTGSLALYPGSILQGNGLLDADVFNHGGTIAAGTSPGILTLASNLVQTSGFIAAEVGGAVAGTNYDRIVVNGAATLNGTLQVSRLNNYTPNITNTFVILTASSLSGGFTNITGLDAGGSLEFVPAVTPGNVVLTMAFSTGPRIIALAPTNSVSNSLSSFTVTFSEPVVASSFTTTDVSLTGPGGAVAITSIDWLNQTNYAIRFAAQAAQGNYTLAVGPGITDVAGNAMNQDGDSSNGEAGQDAFQTVVSLTDNAPPTVASVTPSGGTVNNVSSLVITFNEPVSAATFTTADLALSGPSGNIVVTSLTSPDNRIWTASFALQSAQGTYAFTIGPSLQDLQGNAMQSAYAGTFTIDRAGPSITGMTPSGSITQAVAFVDLVFTEALNAATFTTADVSLTGPSGSVATTSVSGVGGSTYRVAFPQQAANGTYTLIVGPNIADPAGNPMNQDGDGSFGEATQDRYTNSFTISSPDLAVFAVAGPANVLPGQTFTVTWAVTNSGNATVNRSIAEVVFLSADAAVGDDVRIAVFDLTNSLAPGDWIGRTQQVTMPLNGPAGSLRLVVQTDANGDVPEGNETNNYAIAAGTLSVSQALTLQFAASSVTEGGSVAAIVSRNGPATAALVVGLSSIDPTELSAPASVTISAGQTETAFNLTAIVDGLPDGPQIAGLLANASSFVSATGSVTVLDADIPTLGVVISNAIISESQTGYASVTRQGSTAAPLTVLLGSSSPGQLIVPASVTIPSGQSSAAFTTFAVDDAYVESSRGYTVTASAAGLADASGTVTVLDNDQPLLLLTLDQRQIREGAGADAATLTVSRVADAPIPVDVQITASLANELLFASTVTFSPGELAKRVPLSPKDDLLVEPNREVTLLVRALETLSLNPIAPGVATNVVVLDDDGPFLTLTFSRDWVCDGQGPASPLASVAATVTRSVPTNSATTVSLSADVAGLLALPPSVVIPANATSVVFNISYGPIVPTNDPSAVVTATADGLSSAVGALNRLAGCQPDLVIANLVVPTNGVTDAYFSVNFREQNVGAAFAIANLPPGVTNISQKVYLSSDPYPGGDTFVGAVMFNGQANPYVFLDRNATFRLPSVPGDYWVVVEADGSNTVAEANEGNNFTVSALPIRVGVAYTATVTAPFDSAPAGTPVTLSGAARQTGTTTPAPFELVNLHIGLRGTTRVISALTDANGNFSATFTPLPGEAGAYTVGAAHPGVTNGVPAQDTFTLVGMRANPATLAVVIPALTTVTQLVSLANLGDVALSGLNLSVIGLPPEFSASATIPGNLAPFASTDLPLVLGVTADTNLTRTFTVRATSGEGAVADVLVTVTAQSLRPKLVALPLNLSSGVVPGSQRFVEFTVVNQGGAPSGQLTVQPPVFPFVRLLSPPTLPALAPGASNSVTLQLAPGTNQALGLYAGDILVTDGSASVAVPAQFRVVSTNTGSLLVEVTDQFTYYAEGSPRVTNAVVELKDPYTGSILQTRTNDTLGVVLFTNLTEGYYSVGVTAAEHEPFTATLFVSAATTTYQEALMNRETVQFFWNVTPTEIGDRTRISIEAVFETVVPVPVLTVSPSVIDLANYPNGGSINLTITNHGLLAAQAVQLAFSQFDCWRLTPLISDVGTLAARSSITIPVAICRDLSCSGNFNGCPDGGGTGSQISLSSNRKSVAKVLADVRGTHSGGGGGGCGGAAVTYFVPCGTGGVGGSAPVGVSNAGGGGCGGGIGGGGYANASGDGSIIVPTGVAGNCNPCALAVAGAAIGCVIDWALPLPDILACMKGSYECYQEPTAAGCLSAIISCLEAAGKEVPLIGDVLDALDCANSLLTACGGPGLAGFGGGGGGGGGGAGGNSFVGGGSTASSLRQLSSLRALHGPRSYPYPGMAEVDLSGGHVLAVLGVYSEFFGGDQWLVAASSQRFGNWLTLLNSGIDAGGETGARISANERGLLVSSPLTNDISVADINRFVDRWNRTLDYRDQGILYSTNVPAQLSTDFIAVDLQRSRLALANAAVLEAQSRGYANVFEEFRDAMLQLRAAALQPSGGICAQVRLRIDQEAVIARDAFRASLEIVNGSESPMSNITVNLMVTDSAGRIVNPLFAIPAPVVSGIGSIDGTGQVVAGGRGTAAWTIVPTTESAPSGEVVYYVSGSIRYTQNGAPTVVPLAAQAITVYPLAQLQLTYFHQRDVLGDDPFTDAVEPSVPYSLAAMIRNTGAGTARNVRITSAQPKIIENEKGLFIDFQIIATEVAGQNVLPSLTANFGDIAPGGLKIGRWLLKSTLQGLFVDYSASFEHLDTFGDPRASIIQGVDIRELIRVVSAPGVFQDGLPDMLANDFQDIEDLPDTLYLSDGSVQHVSIVKTGAVSGVLSPGNLQVTLAAALPGGWSYLRVPDPGRGLYRLKQVVRSDNVSISLGTNAWTSDRTFVGGGRKPVLENNLHLLDYNSPGSYTLVYEPLPAPDLVAPVSAVAALPAGSFAQIPLSWSGTDTGSGIASFDIYVSVDGAPATLWLDNTPLFGAVYPGSFGSSYAFYSVASDQAGNTEAAPGSPDAVTTVNRVNSPPVLTVGTNVVVSEGTTVFIANGATDPDSDVQTLTFSLAAGSPPNASIQPANGLVTWPTGEGTGPSTNVIGIVVADNGSPALSATGFVTVVVNEVNQAPVIAPAGPFTIREGVLFSHTFTATDADLPANTVRWSLGAGAPAGTAIGTNTGLFTWTPTPLQGPSTNSIQIIATDSGQPALATSRFVTVTVRDSQGDFILAVGATNLFIGESNSVPVQFNAGVDLATVGFSLTTDDQRLTNWQLRGVSPLVGSASLVPSGANRVAVSFTALPGQTLPVGSPLALFDFRSLTNAPSGFVRLQPQAVLGQLTGGTVLSNGLAYSGRVVVIGEQPLLDALNGVSRELVLWGNPGQTYRVDFVPELGASWLPWRTNTPVAARTSLPAHDNLSPVFYRAVLIPAAP